MEYAKSSRRQPNVKVRVLYSPSTHRVIAPVNTGMIGTIQLDESFRTECVIYAAPIDIKDMADSWSNQDIDDWEERDIMVWADLADSRTC